MRIHNLLLVCLIVLGGVATGAGFAADDGFFEQKHLVVDGDPIDYVVADLNADNLPDLLFFHLRSTGAASARLFSVFFQKETGFSTEADQCFEVDPGAIVYTVADVAPAPGREILFFKSDGLFYYALESGQFNTTPAPLIETDSMFRLPDASFLEQYDFARDLNGDGVDEVIVPQFQRVVIHHRDRHGNFTDPSVLDVAMQVSIRSAKDVSRYLVSAYIVPNLVVADYNNDQRADLVFVQETSLRVFFQTPQGGFSNQDAATVDLGNRLTKAYATRIRDHNKFLRDRFKDKTGVKAVEDLNNDGLPDVILETFTVSKSAFNPTKMLKIYFGRPAAGGPALGAVFAPEPDNVIVTTGFPGRCAILDINGDRHKDLLVPSVELGFFKVIRILLSGKADIDVCVFKGSENGYSAEKPDRKITFTMDIDRKGRRLPVSDLSGDFNGDGQPDFLGAEGDAVVILFNPNDENLQSDPDITFPVNIPENGMKVNPHYLSADPYSDIVIVYSSDADGIGIEKKTVCLLVNRKGGN